MYEAKSMINIKFVTVVILHYAKNYCGQWSSTRFVICYQFIADYLYYFAF